eukprot:13391682-Alexandrium_andersonii.AAC.1
MSASLVGSEMCIRDRSQVRLPLSVAGRGGRPPRIRQRRLCRVPADSAVDCLLYTSDAADDM